MKRFTLIYLFSLFAFVLFSQTSQIESLQKQQQALQEEIRSTNRLYLDVQKHTTTILDRINLINKQISSRKELINLRNQEIAALKNEESRLESEISRLNKELKRKQESYANAMKGMLNNKFSQNKLLFILTGRSLGESLRRMQYLREYSRWQKMQAQEIKVQNAEITAKKESLALTRAGKEEALALLRNEQIRLQEEEKARQSEVAEARGQQQKLKKSIQDKQRRASQLNAQIERLIAEEVARQEREAEAARRAEEAERRKRAEREAAKGKREGEKSREAVEKEEAAGRKEEAAPSGSPAPRIEVGASTASAETFNLSKNFAVNKGRLPMPVSGTVSIVGNFGTKKHSEWNVTTNSNGIDIQAQRDANIRTVFDGEVSKVFSFPGSNTCVIVRHGEYYTFYANIYDLFVKQGDKVKTGQSLGRIFTDPDTGVSTMHFQLWQKTTKLNPAPWLQR